MVLLLPAISGIIVLLRRLQSKKKLSDQGMKMENMGSRVGSGYEVVILCEIAGFDVLYL